MNARAYILQADDGGGAEDKKRGVTRLHGYRRLQTVTDGYNEHYRRIHTATYNWTHRAPSIRVPYEYHDKQADVLAVGTLLWWVRARSSLAELADAEEDRLTTTTHILQTHSNTVVLTAIRLCLRANTVVTHSNTVVKGRAYVTHLHILNSRQYRCCCCWRRNALAIALEDVVAVVVVVVALALER